MKILSEASYEEKYLKWILVTSMMTKSKVERMTCQNACSSWITYQKRYIQNLLECANSVIEDQIEDIVRSYNHIKKLKDVYQQTIKDEVAKQEISKLELFNESKLKIKLSKFSGYNSKLDAYTSFHSEFIKIYK